MRTSDQGGKATENAVGGVSLTDPGMPRTLCVDFDAVLHEYHGWNGPVARGNPIPGAFATLDAMRQQGYRIEVFSTRPASNIRAWLEHTGGVEHVDLIRDGKPYYLGFFDDRAHNVTPNSPNGLRWAFEDFRLSQRLLQC